MLNRLEDVHPIEVLPILYGIQLHPFSGIGITLINNVADFIEEVCRKPRNGRQSPNVIIPSIVVASIRF